jgi:hypothetical protein
VPALLVDLTNTIRHGDICLMGESDPCLIEMKASKNLDSRGKSWPLSLVPAFHRVWEIAFIDKPPAA